MRRHNSLIIGLLFCIATFISILSFAEVNFPWFRGSNQWTAVSRPHATRTWELDTSQEYTVTPLNDKQPMIRFYTFEITEGYTYINNVRRKQTFINEKFPAPVIQAIEGDQVVIELINNSNRPVSLHLHGLSMRGTNFMDGMVGLTQCAIKPGHSYRYTFIAQDVGAYWYHNHFQADEILGLYGPILIYDRNEVVDYDQDMLVVVSSIYSQDPEALLDDYFEPYLGGVEPEPDQALIQGKRHAILDISSGKRYRFHLINMCSYLGFWFSIEGHVLEINAVDGFKVQPRAVYQIPIAAAQRYTFFAQADSLEPVIEEKNSSIYLKVDKRGAIGINFEGATGILQHGTPSLVGKPLPQPMVEEYPTLDFNKFDLEFSPLENITLPPLNTRFLALVATMVEDEYGVMTPGFNGSARRMDGIPVLANILGPAKYHQYGNLKPINEMEVSMGDVLDIVILNQDDSSHPFHLHGHKFWVLERQGIRSPTPIKRDTVWVDQDGGWVRIRVQLDNPGVWGLHCHNIWHAVGGMQYVIVVDPQILSDQKPPREWWGLCEPDELPLIRL